MLSVTRGRTLTIATAHTPGAHVCFSGTPHQEEIESNVLLLIHTIHIEYEHVIAWIIICAQPSTAWTMKSAPCKV